MAIPVREMPKPTPTELTTPINPDGSRAQSVDGHRRLFCPHYDPCLDEAVKRGWNSFTCVRCPLYKLTGELAGGLETYATQRRNG